MTLVLLGMAANPACAQVSAPGEISIAIESLDGAAVITIRDLPQALLSKLRSFDTGHEPWAEMISVRAAESKPSTETELPSMLGRYALRGDHILFLPRFPLSSRTTYFVRFNAKAIGYDLETLDARLQLQPKPSIAVSRVNHVYPSTNIIPANLLKFYIDFSRPMSRGMGHEYIRLMRGDGTRVEDPFPEIGVELWDLKQQRFTLLLDPGRIKRGIRINEEMGLPLVPGGRYLLKIDAAWPDAQGNPLAEGYTKSFRVTAPDRTSPDPANWRINAPAAASRDPITVIVPGSLDAALMARLISLDDPDARRVTGWVTLESDERRWNLQPDAAWRSGTYTLRIDSRLEDLAGNQIRRLFERDVKTSEQPAPDEVLSIPVAIR